MGPWEVVTFERLVKAFEVAADTARAAQMAAYMRGQCVFFGIPAPRRGEIQRSVFGAAPRPDAYGAHAFAEVCWAADERELQYAAIDLLRRHARLFGPDDLDWIRELVTSRSWWDTVDGLTPLVGTIVKADPACRVGVDAWLVDDDRWLNRAALVHQERWGRETDADWLFAACRRHARHQDFFVRKAIGWALRSYAKAEPERVALFVAEQHGQLAGLSVREAQKGIAIGRARS